MRVLIVKLSALGDVLRTTSLLKPLRRRHRGAKIWWLTDPAAAPLLEGNPLVDKVLTISSRARARMRLRMERGTASRPRRRPGAAALLEDRLRGGFELVLSLEEDPVTASLAVAACRGKFIGVYPGVEGGPPPRNAAKALRYTSSSARYYDMSLLNRGPDGGLALANRLKAANRLSYARLWLRVLGLPVPKDIEALRPGLCLRDRDHRAARGLARRHGLKPGRAIGINPGAGKRWPAKQLSEGPAARLAADCCRRFGRPVVIFGGRDETARNRRIVALARRLLGGDGAARRAVIDGGTRHELRSFAGIVALCGVVVSTDSLAFHIATALGKPVAALVGPTSAVELDVFGRGAKLTPPGGCSCFYKPECRFKKNCLDRMEKAPVLDIVGRCLR